MHLRLGAALKRVRYGSTDATPEVSRRSPLVALLLVVLSTLLFATSAAGSTKPPGFTGPTTLPGSDGGSEPSLAISTTGIRYPSWQAPGEFASSRDAAPLTNLGKPDAGALGAVPNAVDPAAAPSHGQLVGAPPTR